MKATSGHAWQSLKHSWEQQGRRCGPRNPTTFPFEVRAPRQEAAAQHCTPHTGPSVLHCSAHRLLPCWAANTPTLSPRKTLGNAGMATCFISGHLAALRDQHESASYFDICWRQHAARSVIHFLLAKLWVSAWSWHLWFLRSQLWHCRTREHLAGVSNLLPVSTLSSRYITSWATTCPYSFCVSRLPLVSICKYFPSHPSTSSPAEPRSFHEILGFHLPTLRAKQKLLLSAKTCSWPNSSSK